MIVFNGRSFDVPPDYVDRVNARISRAIDGYDVRFETASIHFTNFVDPHVILQDVSVTTGDEESVIDFSQVDMTIDGLGLLFGNVQPKSISINGSLLHLKRNGEGEFNVSFATNEAQSFDSLNHVFDEIEGVFDRPNFRDLQSASVNGLTVRYDDELSGDAWTFDGGRFSLGRDKQADSLEMRVDLALLTGGQDPATLAISYKKVGPQSAILSADLDGILAQDIAGQLPAFAWLKLVQAPISGNFRTKIDASATEPLFATLNFGQGQILPQADVETIHFTEAKAYLTYLPAEKRLDISTLSLRSDWGDFNGQGAVLLQGQQFVVSLTSTGSEIEERGGLHSPVSVESAGLDMRLDLNPVKIDIAQAFVKLDGTIVRGRGVMRQGLDGWSHAFELYTERLVIDHAMQHWPLALAPKLRSWLDENISALTAHNISLGVHREPGIKPEISASFSFEDGTARFLKEMPNLENARGYAQVINNQFDLHLMQGNVDFGEYGSITAAGSSMTIEDVRLKPATGQFNLKLAGDAAAAFAALNRKPLEVFEKAGRSHELGTGFLTVDLSLTVPLRKHVPVEDVVYQARGELHDFVSTTLVPKQTVRADVLNINASSSGVNVKGNVRLGDANANIVWQQVTGEKVSHLSADLQVNERTLKQFNINLPENTISGSARTSLDVSLQANHPPRFTASSNLRGLGIAIPAIDWRKPKSSRGAFKISGTFAEVPSVSGLSLSAEGLSAQGDLELKNGRLMRANLRNVSIGEWFSGNVRLTNRGEGQPMALRLGAARIDIRSAPFGKRDSTGRRGPAIPPISGNVRKLIIGEGLALTDMRVDTLNGRGRFSGKVNGGSPVSGAVSLRGRQTIIDLVSNDVSGILRDVAITPNGTGGTLSLRLQSQPNGGWLGRAKVLEARVKDAPMIAEFLSAVSVVGILEQLDGKGLMLSEVLVDFGIKGDILTVYSSSAIGPSLGLSLDGYVNMRTKQIDLQGVISPFYIVNRLGAIFTRRGEGLIGVNFTLKGTLSDMRVGVNPISILAPGFFREIFRRSAPKVTE